MTPERELAEKVLGAYLDPQNNHQEALLKIESLLKEAMEKVFEDGRFKGQNEMLGPKDIQQARLDEREKIARDLDLRVEFLITTKRTIIDYEYLREIAAQIREGK